MRRPFTITQLRRHPELGFWQARITHQGEVFDVDCRFGSWQAPKGLSRVDVMPDVAGALQAKVRPLERAERRAAA